MSKPNLHQRNVAILKIFWLFFGINIIVQILFIAPYKLWFLLVQILELIVLLLAAFLLMKRSWNTSGSPGNLEKVLDELNIVTWSFDMRQNKYFFSEGIEQISGCKAGDFSKQPALFRKLVHPYDLFRVKEAERDLLAGKKNMIEHRILMPSGETRWINNMAVPIKDSSGQVLRLEGLIIDVTREKELEQKMTQMALSDELTGLPNRRMFEKYFAHFVARSQYISQKLAIVFIDLDSFKAVNDKLGHDRGDLLLKEVTVRLKTIFRGTDFLSRLGGDEFVALLTRISKDSLIMINERILDAFSRPFLIDGYELAIGASVGISIYPTDGEDLETLIKNADQAMYVAKNKGKNTYHFYNGSLWN